MAVAPIFDQSAPSFDKTGASSMTNPGKLLAESNSIASLPVVADIPQSLGFPAIQNIFRSSASQLSESRVMSSVPLAASTAGGRVMKGDKNDDDDGDDRDDGDGDNDGGGGNNWIANFISQIPILGGLLGGLFGGGLMGRFSSGGGCNGGDCSQRMAMRSEGGCCQRMSPRSRVPGLNNEVATLGYGTPMSMLRPGFGPFSNNKSI